MKITAVCSTFNRPELLGRAIECFKRQTYEDRELVIFDDAGQYHGQCGDRWRIITHNTRSKTMADKFNTAISLVPEAEAIAVWDDDDVYLPHALENCAVALQKGVWTQPRFVYEQSEGGLIQISTKRDAGGFAYHGSWAFTRNAFEKAGGYKDPTDSLDYYFGISMEEVNGPSVDATEGTEPYYIFCRPTDEKRAHESWPFGENYPRRDDRDTEPIVSDTLLNIDWKLDYTKLSVVEYRTGSVAW